MVWNEEAWQIHNSLRKTSNAYGSTSSTAWRYYYMKHDGIDKDVTMFLNSTTCEVKAMVLTEVEDRWLQYGATLAAPTERLAFFHNAGVLVEAF